jgi:deoxyribonuclease-4
LDLAAGLGGGVVVHIGSCKDAEKGMFTISRTVETVLEANSKATAPLSRRLGLPVEEFRRTRKVILENAAGEGTKIGSNLDEIAQIIEGVKGEVRDQVKVCIDTAHIFGAGQYDFGNPAGVVQFFDDFDSKIGLDRLELFHLNDSRVEWGSRKDRHENLKKGFIFGDRRRDDLDGTEGLKVLLEKAEELRIPLVGEPPAKTASGEKAPGGVWDYDIVRGISNLEERCFCCE